jgi:hypothetical protein
MVRQPDLPIQAPDADRLGAASSTRESIEAPAVGAPTPQRRLTPAAVLELQRTAGNAAAQRYIARQPPPAAAPAGAPAADAGSPADTAVPEMILGDGGREKAFGACQAAHGQWDAAANGFEALKRPEPTLGYAAAAHLGEADGARAYAYLKYGTLRLADKLFIAGIGAGTDNETIWRLLPAVRTSYTQSEQDFVDAYTKQGRDAYGAYYTGVGELLDGSKSYLADFLDDEFDGADLAKAMALLTYGEVRPVDGIHIALSSVHMLSTSIMAAVEKAGREAPANSKGLLERQYLETYKQPLRDRLRGELGEASADFKRAQLVLDGDFTAKNRIKIACEGLGTDEDEVWKALQDAPDTELDGLREEWKRGGEIKTLITDELGGDDLKRFTAVMENRGNMAGRLAQFGVDVADVQGVIKAGLERVEVETAFREEWAQPTGDFRRQFTGEERIGAAMLWGDQLASSDPVKRVRLAAELASGAGVLRILVADIHTDAQRKLITDDGQLLGMLKGMDDWPRYESLLAPHEDLKARSDWMAEKFKREQGWWGDSASRFGPEARRRQGPAQPHA